LATKLIYRSSLLYETVMRLLYGRHYQARSQAVAGLIPPDCSVVDLCCGPGLLYREYLKAKDIDYTGLDASPFFVRKLTQRGIPALLWDLNSARPLPRADYLIMQSALCYFLPDPSSIIGRMLDAARRAIIIAEPIRNLSTSRFSLLRQCAIKLSGPPGENPKRFTEETLDRFFSNYAEELREKFLIPGGREKVYLLAPPPVFRQA
jgi:SAM-dependent methyltransferase